LNKKTGLRSPVFMNRIWLFSFSS